MKYYYLIATLPDLSLEDESSNVDFSEIIETIKRNLSKEDYQTFKYLIYPHDNRNLLNEIFKKHHGLIPLPFRQPSEFDRTIIGDYEQELYNFPDYIGDFLMNYQERFPEMGMDEIESHLMKGFYQEVSLVPDAFVTDYYLFEKRLKSMVAAFNLAVYPFYSRESELEDAEITGKLANRGTGASQLTQTYPFAEYLWEAIHSKDPLAIEQMFDQIKWEFIDNYHMEFFSNQHVYSYTLKLFILQRWVSIEQADAKRQFEKLSNQIGAFKALT